MTEIIISNKVITLCKIFLISYTNIPGVLKVSISTTTYFDKRYSLLLGLVMVLYTISTIVTKTPLHKLHFDYRLLST